MSTITKEFTKEQLQQIEAAAKEVLWPVVWSEKKAREHFSEKITPKVVLKLARIALASLEAEAVMNEIVIPEPATHRNINEICPPGVNQTLFASGWNASRKSGMNSGRIPPIVKGIDAECIGWNACRAAMLQGADGNSPVIPDGWVACSERMPEREVDVQVYCSDKKEQMVGYMERNERNGYFRFASLPNGGGVYCQPTHWMPLPAAPQQEVK